LARRAHPSAIGATVAHVQRCHVMRTMKALSALGPLNRFRTLDDPPETTCRRRAGDSACGARSGDEPGTSTTAGSHRTGAQLGINPRNPKKCCPDKSKRHRMRVFPS